MSYSSSSAGGRGQNDDFARKGERGTRGWVAVCEGVVAVRGKGVADVWRPFTRFRRGAAARCRGGREGSVGDVDPDGEGGKF